MYLYCKSKGNILHFSFRKKIEFKIYCFLTVGRGSKIMLFLQSEAKEGFWKILGIHQTDGLASSSKIFSHFANSQIQIIITIMQSQCFLQEKVWTVQIKFMSQPANAKTSCRPSLPRNFLRQHLLIHVCILMLLLIPDLYISHSIQIFCCPQLIKTYLKQSHVRFEIFSQVLVYIIDP